MNEKDGDKMYTIIIPGEPIKGEPIPPRGKTDDKNNKPKSLDINLKHSTENPPQYDRHLSKLLKKPSIPKYISSQTNQPDPIVESEILGLNKNPLKRNFYELALKNVDKTVEHAIEVPFMCYWPSYELMSAKQLNWYFYLRTNFRNYKYIKTDLSYIFLYIYELINGIGIADKEDGLFRLIKIWNAYKDIYKNLNNYLPEWITDYMNIYDCRSDEAFILLKSYDLTSFIPENLIISHYIDKNLTLPIEVIANLSNYAFYKSNFVIKKEQIPSDKSDENENPDNGKMFLEGLPKLINKIDIFMKNEGQGIFEAFKPDTFKNEAKIPFRSAVFEQNLRLSSSTLCYDSYKPLRNFITSVIRHYENELRILTGYRGRLKAEPLPEKIIKIIKSTAEEHFTQSRKKDVIVTVDKDKLIKLMKDAEITRKKLLDHSFEFEENNEKIAAEETPEVIINEINNKNDIKTELKEYDDWKIIEKTDTKPLSQSISHTPGSDGENLISSLSENQKMILAFLLQKGGRCDEKTLVSQFENMFINIETDQINEKSLEIFYDLLIAYEDGEWYIIKDYIDEIIEFLQ